MLIFSIVANFREPFLNISRKIFHLMCWIFSIPRRKFLKLVHRFFESSFKNVLMLSLLIIFTFLIHNKINIAEGLIKIPNNKLK